MIGPVLTVGVRVAAPALLLAALPGDAFGAPFTWQIGEEPAAFTGRLFQIIALMTVLSLAPWILMTVTSFIRIVIVLSLLRTALGLQQTPPNMVVISLALFLTAFIMAPTVDKAWQDGINPMLNDVVTPEQGIERTIAPFRQFMQLEVRSKDLALFQSLRGPDPQGRADETVAAAPKGLAGSLDALEPQRAEGEAPLSVLVPAFIISELRRAFEIGFLVFMPFLVVDIVVAAILMAMGMMMLPPAIVSLPFKVVFFVMIDGWNLIAGNLVKSFAGG
ncbi:MAG: flagellar type III secretion system pore protein FliP [Alphaproteobacteria bacterium]